MSRKEDKKINQKQSIIEKTAAGATITPAQLEKINSFTRRKLNTDDIFTFSIILCDNEIDRDGERFTCESLEVLAELYRGKTGIFDHSAQAKHQSARIFDTEIIVDEHRQVPGGEAYTWLKAWAYMVRCDKNHDLILEIDAGIKKEVSVGCAVGKILCSVCGADQKQNACTHQKGESYGGIICHHVLCNPTDAYEWSFVAVPAQRSAGVIKGYMPLGNDLFERINKSSGGINLNSTEVQVLKTKLAQLESLCKAGEEYISTLRHDFIRKACLAQPALEPATLEDIASTMTTSQLKSLCKGFAASATAALPCPQLIPQPPKDPTADYQFLI